MRGAAGAGPRADPARRGEVGEELKEEERGPREKRSGEKTSKPFSDSRQTTLQQMLALLELTHLLRVFRINIKNNNAVIEPLCFFDPTECGERKREKREKKEGEVEVEFFFLFFRSVD